MHSHTCPICRVTYPCAWPCSSTGPRVCPDCDHQLAQEEIRQQRSAQYER